MSRALTRLVSHRGSVSLAVFPQHDDECVISLPLLLSRIKRVSCRSEDLNELCKKKKKKKLGVWAGTCVAGAKTPGLVSCNKKAELFIP